MTKQFITRKDLFYWLLFAVITIFLLVTNRLHGNGNAVSYIGFAATLVSIALALVAIVYSFFQGQSFSGVNDQIIEAGRNISRLTENLVNSSAGYETRTQTILESFERISEQLNTTLDAKFESTKSHLAAKIEELKALEPAPKPKEEEENAAISDAAVVDFVENSSPLGKYVMYAVVRMQQVGQEIPIKDFLKKSFEAWGDYAYGYYVAMSSMSLFEREGKKESMKITAVHPIIEKNILAQIDELERNHKYPHREAINANLSDYEVPF